MSLTRIINCLTLVNPEVYRMVESDAEKGFLLKMCGAIGGGITAFSYWANNARAEEAIAAGVLSTIIYIAGAAKDYLSLRKADKVLTDLEQHEKDVKELSIYDYNEKYNSPNNKGALNE